jgi:signal transduction histidine kinase
MLALPVAQKIVALHAGTFHFHSAQGAGTKITMALPKK